MKPHTPSRNVQPSFSDSHELAWEEISCSLVAPTPIFDLFKVARRAPDGREGDFYLLDTPDWVTVVPFLGSLEELKRGEGSFVMIEQFRHGNGKVLIEFPAGTIDPGEKPKEAALRELVEETGRRPGQMEFLGAVCPNPAFMNNRGHFFLATGLSEEGAQELDEHEEIRLHTVPVPEVLENMGTQSWDNGVMMIALAYLHRYLATL